MRSTARGGLADEDRQCALESQGHPPHERAVTKHKPVFRLIQTLVMQDQRKQLSAGLASPAARSKRPPPMTAITSCCHRSSYPWTARSAEVFPDADSLAQVLGGAAGLVRDRRRAPLIIGCIPKCPPNSHWLDLRRAASPPPPTPPSRYEPGMYGRPSTCPAGH